MGISLEKNVPISLAKQAPGLTKIRMGLGWDPAGSAPAKGFLAKLMASSKPAEVDLDASCLIYSGTTPVADVWFSNKQALGGAVWHSGDNLTGEGDGDDDTIHVDLEKVAQHGDALVFTVHSFRGQPFSAVTGASCRLLDGEREIAHYSLSTQQPPLSRSTAMLMAILRRGADGWQLMAVGEAMQGQTFRDNRDQIRAALQR